MDVLNLNHKKKTKIFKTVTPRTVESLIRLAKAHAKARFSKIVEAQDVKTAVELINVSYFQQQ